MLVERKDQLKEDLAASKEEVDQWKSKFRSHDQHRINVRGGESLLGRRGRKRWTNSKGNDKVQSLATFSVAVLDVSKNSR